MTDPLQDPGVSGLAQLGRNAIERVGELERENAELRAALKALLSALDFASHLKAIEQARAVLAKAGAT
jgi:hypothetical protein